MEYITKELTYYNGFTIEMVCKNGLELMQENLGYYSLILVTDGSLNLTLRDGASQMICGSGVLVLSEHHGIAEIAQLSVSPSSSARTLIFSPGGINTNFEAFPDSFEYKLFTELSDGFTWIPLSDQMLETFVHHFNRINEEMNLVQSSFWPCLGRRFKGHCKPHSGVFSEFVYRKNQAG